jgi:SRSO17 transposase
MTARHPVPPAPGPLEAYAKQYDALFARRSQREGFRLYLEGLLTPTNRRKTLTTIAKSEPTRGANSRLVQSLQWFISESNWDPDAINTRRIELIQENPASEPGQYGIFVPPIHSKLNPSKM